MAKFCKKQAIFFKTKRGRTVRFVGRKSGSEVCGKKRPTVAQRELRRAFATIARKCNAKRKSLQKQCWKTYTRSDRPQYVYKRRSVR
ncbi:MAG: hypothetical protein WC729_29605 [Sphingomonas sp.]|jgi:hypothetical protein|uniref:hypothetical protein n=1 Tax=Sphingomonas sp. TaxID=28214 RepID=UPI003569CDB5